MCNHEAREAAMTVLDEKTWCDPCLVPLIKALNDGGIRTVASCCGHGHRPGNVMLADGRVLLVLPDTEWDRWLAKKIHERVGDMPGHEPTGATEHMTPDDNAELQRLMAERRAHPFGTVHEVDGLQPGIPAPPAPTGASITDAEEAQPDVR